MALNAHDKELIKKGVQYVSSRSSGPGGQNVNKVESRITLYYDLGNSLLKPSQIHKIKIKLKNKINSEGVLQISNQETRSQLENKRRVLDLFFKLIEKALFVPKPRKKSTPNKTAIQKRLDDKKRRSEIKSNRNYRY